MLKEQQITRCVWASSQTAMSDSLNMMKPTFSRDPRSAGSKLSMSINFSERFLSIPKSCEGEKQNIFSKSLTHGQLNDTRANDGMSLSIISVCFQYSKHKPWTDFQKGQTFSAMSSCKNRKENQTWLQSHQDDLNQLKAKSFHIFQNLLVTAVHLLFEKGVYPYSHFTSFIIC